MEVFTFYSQTVGTIAAQEMQRIAPQAVFNHQESPHGTYFQFRWTDMAMECSLMPRSFIKEHMLQLAGDVRSADGGRHEERTARLVDRLLRTRLVMTVQVEPARDDEGRANITLAKLAVGLDAVVLTAGVLFDKRFKLLMAPDGSFDPAAELSINELVSTSMEAEARKARSIARLQSEGVPFINALPVIADEHQVNLRTAQEVARRALALAVISARLDGRDTAEIAGWVEKFHLAEDLSEEEKTFLTSPQGDEQMLMRLSWRSEAALALLWTLSKIETLERPDKYSRVEPLYRLLELSSKQAWLENLHLRPASKILDALDLHYRYHWAVVDARLQLRLPPAGLNPDVVQQRHYALNWLTGYMDQPWDAVTTDT